MWHEIYAKPPCPTARAARNLLLGILFEGKSVFAANRKMKLCKVLAERICCKNSRTKTDKDQCMLRHKFILCSGLPLPPFHITAYPWAMSHDTDQCVQRECVTMYGCVCRRGKRVYSRGVIKIFCRFNFEPLVHTSARKWMTNRQHVPSTFINKRAFCTVVQPVGQSTQTRK